MTGIWVRSNACPEPNSCDALHIPIRTRIDSMATYGFYSRSLTRLESAPISCKESKLTLVQGFLVPWTSPASATLASRELLKLLRFHLHRPPCIPSASLTYRQALSQDCFVGRLDEIPTLLLTPPVPSKGKWCSADLFYGLRGYVQKRRTLIDAILTRIWFRTLSA